MAIHPRLLLAAALAASAIAAAAPPPSYPSAVNYDALEGVHDLKMAFDVTDGNPQVLAAKLSNIDTTRKQLIDAGVTPHIVVTFRGDASYYTQGDVSKVKPEDRAGHAKVAEVIRQLRKQPGVESFEQCSLPLPSRKIDKADIMPEVKVVPNGWIALVAYQQKGYAYIAP
ncbi:MAG TPA: DsrE family protein [Usitatibacter sp.]|nr:DsrE family protein [Usitatibacter sp.]